MRSYASNAVLSKARAMYGKRIKDRNYNEIIMCKNVTEIALYLKNRTSYHDVLASMDDNDVHRGKLEEKLRKKLFYDFAKLGRYDLSVGEKFFKYIISRAEIEKIMHSLMFFKSNKSGSYNYPLPKIFENHTKINFHALSSIKDYDSFLDAIKNSPYYKILLPFRPKNFEGIDLTAIETALYTYLYKIMFEIIKSNLRGKNQSELNDLFNSYIDLSNIIRIDRMRKNYNLSSSYMMSSLLPFGNFTKQQIKDFVNCKNEKQLELEFLNTKLGSKWINKDGEIKDTIPKIMRFSKCTHYIRFSISPPVVLMSYIFLKEIEILNLTNIIECVRYGIPAEEIKSMLIK